MLKYTIILANLSSELFQEAKRLSITYPFIHSFFPWSVPSDLNKVCQFVTLYIIILIVLEANVIYC
jgi:hypothetical protein